MTLIKKWVSILELRILLVREKGPVKSWVRSQKRWHICGDAGNERPMSPRTAREAGHA